ncbi:hypothetical protein [Terrabacter sp. MAHUQ-38]|uniref:DUF7668 domain-containing protein n=1 Tax=unclassified Terrabacter TaxID=2630222 RepID=UPI00165E551A|nr:hypothetical protein [Terrabacter sp. MAHUQ-38]MBC9819697.1 hypothetical protein [Terrabacter sp. MAHUQ-38]
MNVIRPPEGEEEGPIPLAWRPTLTAIVDSLVRRDPVVAQHLQDVERVSDAVRDQCVEALAAYGDIEFVRLPKSSWDSSVCQKWGDYWRCYIDLWTAQEGRSDLVLEVTARVTPNGFRFAVGSAYVP